MLHIVTDIKGDILSCDKDPNSSISIEWWIIRNSKGQMFIKQDYTNMKIHHGTKYAIQGTIGLLKEVKAAMVLSLSEVDISKIIRISV